MEKATGEWRIYEKEKQALYSKRETGDIGLFVTNAFNYFTDNKYDILLGKEKTCLLMYKEVKIWKRYYI